MSTACGLACLAGCATTGDCHPEYTPKIYKQAAQYSLTHAFETQANNGQVLNETIWNYHFYEDSEDLRLSGREFLDRLANNYPLRCSGLFLQSAHDIQFKPDDVDGYFARRQELNALRTKAVTDYLQHAAPGNTLMVQIHDKPRVGLPSDESGRSYIMMARNAPQGLLSPDITASRFSISGDGGGGGGGNIGAAGGGALPQALSGALPSDSGAPDFSGDVQTGGGPGGSGGGGSLPQIR